MGGTLSFSLGGKRLAPTRIQDEEELRRKERQRLLELYGVLVPPVFVANTSNANKSTPLSLRAAQRLSRESLKHDKTCDLLLWAEGDRWESCRGGSPLLANRLLEEYIRPGLFVSLPIEGDFPNNNGFASNNNVQAAIAMPVLGWSWRNFRTDRKQKEKRASAANKVNHPAEGIKLSSATTDWSTDLSTDPLPSFVTLSKTIFHASSQGAGIKSLAIPTTITAEGFLSEPKPFGSLGPVLPWSVRLMADWVSTIENPNNADDLSSTNRTRWTITTTSNGMMEPNNHPQRLWKDSWIETEVIRPNWCSTGIYPKIACGMTIGELCNLSEFACGCASNAYFSYTGSNHSTPKNDKLSSPKSSLQLKMAAECKEAILAANVRVPVIPLVTGDGPLFTSMVKDTLVSINLNGGNNQTSDLPQSPPLWLTLKRTNTISSSWSLDLSQVVTFDREVWNILEERAPYVRNHFGWVCRVEAQNQREESTSSASTISKWSLGGSAQFNRNIGAKAILESTFGGTGTAALSQSNTANSTILKFAMIFKRWIQPRASLSVIHALDLRKGNLSFLGFGLEIEQGSTSPPLPKGAPTMTAEYWTAADYNAASDKASSNGPPTRVTVPPSTKDHR